MRQSESTRATVASSSDGKGMLVTLDTAIDTEQRVLVAMRVPLTDLVPLFRMKIHAYEQALKVIQGNLELLRKQLPTDQQDQPGGN